MTSPRDPARRDVMTARASLPRIGLAAQTSSSGDVQRTDSRTLVAYFSRYGKTRVAAGRLKQQTE
ncbi:hypothetical protein [Dyella monticola]|uniref:hypothetical protein n=1 Tax=Dyella monticola TaxID=1927958 RepID=UPI0011C05129|nr:hypothetical protein [Dyella monticola]